jgi:hypothetical protein
MSNESNVMDSEMPMDTKPVPEHEWLQQLVGEWRTESVMTMPEGTEATSQGKETVRDLGGLWAYTEGTAVVPDGSTMEYRSAIGYDVSFKEYRGFWLASMSSHLWKYTGEMSADRKTLTLNCVGPHMMKDGETANYRDVIEILDANRRTMSSYGQDDSGEWIPFMKVTYTRV